MESILKKLQALGESDMYPCHMPGHKRCGNPLFAMDITEIDGFDNLHHATGMIKEAQERAAKLYGATESFYLVNGSTCGLLSAIFASFQRGDKVLVARNCHKAVYHGLEIRGIEPVYIYPETDKEYDINVGIKAWQVEEVLKNADLYYDSSTKPIKGMILTSPTYEGLTSEIKEIAKCLHEKEMILIVDEAHGAHFGFHEDFPQSAVGQGADLVIQSLHKTLPSMTQTALLHRCSDRVDAEDIQKYLGIFQTSSPSYVFMAYMDECMHLMEEKGRELFGIFSVRLQNFYKKCENLQHIRVLQPQEYDSDPGKILISAPKRYNGRELYDKLRNCYHLQPEMCSGGYVLAMMTVYDTEEGFERLYAALADLDGKQVSDKSVNRDAKKTLASLAKEHPVMKYMPCDTEALGAEMLWLKDAAGRASKEYIYLYPPGIPFIVPGEIISREMAEAIGELQNCGYEIQGMSDLSGKRIRVIV